MDFMYEIFDDLPRQGPGDDESTRKALSLVKNLPSNADILDVGCGCGKQTLELARNTKGKITAVDTYQYFLDRLKADAEKLGFQSRIETLNISMTVMNFAPFSFDLIWSEGAVYIMGFERGLWEWRRFLKPQSFIAVTEIVWLKENIPSDLKSYWEKKYPEMKTLNENLQVVKNLGYDLLGHFTLPKTCWLDNFYAPLEIRLKTLRQKYQDNIEALKVLDMNKKEADLYKKYSDYYGYEFFVMRDQ